MELVYYIIASWLIAAYLTTHIQKNEIIRSIIVYFVFTMLSVCLFTLIGLNYGLLHFSEDTSKYSSLLLSRNIIIPGLALILINSYHKLATYMKNIQIFILIMLTAFGEFINLRLQLNTYQGRVFNLVVAIYAFSVFIALFFSKFIIAIQLRGDRK